MPKNLSKDLSRPVLGLAYSNLGQVDKAIELMEESLSIFEEIKSPNAAIVRKNL